MKRREFKRKMKPAEFMARLLPQRATRGDRRAVAILVRLLPGLDRDPTKPDHGED